MFALAFSFLFLAMALSGTFNLGAWSCLLVFAGIMFKQFTGDKS
jgi:hypothetical protein